MTADDTRRGARPDRPATPSRRVTSVDVAREAGVSQGLVSRAFSGKGAISGQTREKIFAAARRIGWHPNAIAASMVTGNPPLVAVVAAQLGLDWRAKVLSHLLGEFERRRIVPLMLYASDDAKVDELLVAARSWRTRGVVITAGDISADRARALIEDGQFVISINRPADAPGALAVGTDNVLGGRMAAQTLRDDGRRRLLMLAGPTESRAGSQRRAGFTAQASADDIPAACWHSEAMSVEAGSALAGRWLELPQATRPDGVFAANDLMAIGFIDGLRRAGAYDRAALSLLGYDNLPATGWQPYELTTFAQPVEAIVGLAIDHIRISEDTARPDPATPPEISPMQLLPPRLIRRRTAGSAG